MKRTLIALGVAAAVVAPIANAAPTVYGRLNVTVQSVDNDSRSDEVVQVASNASRIGVKGEEKLTDSLSAVYLIEWGFEADASSSSTSNVTGGGGGSVSTTNSDLTQRNRFLGLKHKSLGTIKAGKIDTLVKQAEGKVDQFGDLSFADIEGVLGAQGGPARADNVIEYNSPKIADLVDFNLQLIQGEETTASGTAAPKRNGLADGYSTSVVLSSGPFWATVAYEKDVSTRTAGWSQTLAPRSTLLSDGTVRVGASYELKDLGRSYGNQQVLLWEKATGQVQAASDPRGIGSSAVMTAAASFFTSVQTAPAPLTPPMLPASVLQRLGPPALGSAKGPSPLYVIARSRDQLTP